MRAITNHWLNSQLLVRAELASSVFWEQDMLKSDKYLCIFITFNSSVHRLNQSVPTDISYSIYYLTRILIYCGKDRQFFVPYRNRKYHSHRDAH